MIWPMLIAGFIPFLVCMVTLMGGHRVGVWANGLGGLATLAFLALLYQPVIDHVPLTLHVFNIAPNIEFGFSLEPLGLVFALLVAPLWAITALYSHFYMMPDDPHLTRFYALLALAIGCTLGLAFASNLLTLFFFYEALTLSTIMLVAHKEDSKSMQAGRFYAFMLVCASLALLLPAIVCTALEGDTLTFTPGGVLSHISPLNGAFLLLLYVFGTAKVALMPMHGWLRRAMVAPTPVSALLHAVAVVKAGGFTLLKVAIYIFGLDTLNHVGAPSWLVVLACITIVSACILALEEDHLKARLAYSTISQLAYIVLGLALATPAAIWGAIIQMFAHAFAKIGLFMSAGSVDKLAHVKRVSHMHGLGLYYPWSFALFFLSSLSIVGMPLFGAFWAKWFLLSGALSIEKISVAIILLISSLLAAAYLLPIPLRAFFDDLSHHHPQTLEAESWQAFVPPLFTTGLAIAIFFFIQPIINLLNAIPLGGL